jgi:hypothetical protein
LQYCIFWSIWRCFGRIQVKSLHWTLLSTFRDVFQTFVTIWQMMLGKQQEHL